MSLFSWESLVQLRKLGEGIVFSGKPSDFRLHRAQGAWHDLTLMIIYTAGKTVP